MANAFDEALTELLDHNEYLRATARRIYGAEAQVGVMQGPGESVGTLYVMPPRTSGLATIKFKGEGDTPEAQRANAINKMEEHLRLKDKEQFSGTFQAPAVAPPFAPDTFDPALEALLQDARPALMPVFNRVCGKDARLGIVAEDGESVGRICIVFEPEDAYPSRSTFKGEGDTPEAVRADAMAKLTAYLRKMGMDRLGLFQDELHGMVNALQTLHGDAPLPSAAQGEKGAAEAQPQADTGAPVCPERFLPYMKNATHWRLDQLLLDVWKACIRTGCEAVRCDDPVARHIGFQVGNLDQAEAFLIPDYCIKNGSGVSGLGREVIRTPELRDVLARRLSDPKPLPQALLELLPQDPGEQPAEEAVEDQEQAQGYYPQPEAVLAHMRPSTRLMAALHAALSGATELRLLCEQVGLPPFDATPATFFADHVAEAVDLLFESSLLIPFIKAVQAKHPTKNLEPFVAEVESLMAARVEVWVAAAAALPQPPAQEQASPPAPAVPLAFLKPSASMLAALHAAVEDVVEMKQICKRIGAPAFDARPEVFFVSRLSRTLDLLLKEGLLQAFVAVAHELHPEEGLYPFIADAAQLQAACELTSLGQPLQAAAPLPSKAEMQKLMAELREAPVYEVFGDREHMLLVKDRTFVVNGNYTVARFDEETIRTSALNDPDVFAKKLGEVQGTGDYNQLIESFKQHLDRDDAILARLLDDVDNSETSLGRPQELSANMLLAVFHVFESVSDLDKACSDVGLDMTGLTRDTYFIAYLGLVLEALTKQQLLSHFLSQESRRFPTDKLPDLLAEAARLEENADAAAVMEGKAKVERLLVGYQAGTVKMDEVLAFFNISPEEAQAALKGTKDAAVSPAPVPFEWPNVATETLARMNMRAAEIIKVVLPLAQRLYGEHTQVAFTTAGNFFIAPNGNGESHRLRFNCTEEAPPGLECLEQSAKEMARVLCVVCPDSVTERHLVDPVKALFALSGTEAKAEVSEETKAAEATAYADSFIKEIEETNAFIERVDECVTPLAKHIFGTEVLVTQCNPHAFRLVLSDGAPPIDFPCADVPRVDRLKHSAEALVTYLCDRGDRIPLVLFRKAHLVAPNVKAFLRTVAQGLPPGLQTAVTEGFRTTQNMLDFFKGQGIAISAIGHEQGALEGLEMAAYLGKLDQVIDALEVVFDQRLRETLSEGDRVTVGTGVYSGRCGVISRIERKNPRICQRDIYVQLDNGDQYHRLFDEVNLTKEAAPAFKLGDRVTYKPSKDEAKSKDQYIGLVGTVKELAKFVGIRPAVGVQLDGDKAIRAFCIDNLTLLPDAPPACPFQPGDFVVYDPTVGKVHKAIWGKVGKVLATGSILTRGPGVRVRFENDAYASRLLLEANLKPAPAKQDKATADLADHMKAVINLAVQDPDAPLKKGDRVSFYMKMPTLLNGKAGVLEVVDNAFDLKECWGIRFDHDPTEVQHVHRDYVSRATSVPYVNTHEEYMNEVAGVLHALFKPRGNLRPFLRQALVDERLLPTVNDHATNDMAYHCAVVRQLIDQGKLHYLVNCIWQSGQYPTINRVAKLLGVAHLWHPEPTPPPAMLTSNLKQALAGALNHQRAEEILRDVLTGLPWPEEGATDLLSTAAQHGLVRPYLARVFLASRDADLYRAAHKAGYLPDATHFMIAPFLSNLAEVTAAIRSGPLTAGGLQQAWNEGRLYNVIDSLVCNAGGTEGINRSLMAALRHALYGEAAVITPAPANAIAPAVPSALLVKNVREEATKDLFRTKQDLSRFVRGFLRDPIVRGVVMEKLTHHPDLEDCIDTLFTWVEKEGRWPDLLAALNDALPDQPFFQVGVDTYPLPANAPDPLIPPGLVKALTALFDQNKGVFYDKVCDQVGYVDIVESPHFAWEVARRLVITRKRGKLLNLLHALHAARIAASYTAHAQHEAYLALNRIMETFRDSILGTQEGTLMKDLPEGTLQEGSRVIVREVDHALNGKVGTIISIHNSTVGVKFDHDNELCGVEMRVLHPAPSRALVPITTIVKTLDTPPVLFHEGEYVTYEGSGHTHYPSIKGKRCQIVSNALMPLGAHSDIFHGPSVRIEDTTFRCAYLVPLSDLRKAPTDHLPEAPAPEPETAAAPQEPEPTGLGTAAALAACKALLVPLLEKLLGGESVGRLMSSFFTGPLPAPAECLPQALEQAHKQGRLAELADVAWKESLAGGNEPASRDDLLKLAEISRQLDNGRVPVLA